MLTFDILLIYINDIYIILLLGLGLMVPGIIVQANVELVNSEVRPLLNQVQVGSFTLGSLVDGLSVTLIVIGVFILILAGLGAFGACCKHKCMLTTYAIIVFVLWLIKVIIVICWIVMRSEKQELSCCGVSAVTGITNDFDNSTWVTSGEAGSQEIPEFCCTGITADNYLTTTPAVTCTHTVTSGYYNKGCYDAAYDMLTEYSGVFIAVGVIILIVEVLAVIFACCICKQTGKDQVV
ncbi:hypothetical protein KUTeg_014500 [Tegillarca granosa]|uniref:Tetraspanin n=1 Tax=Tegillarca granosa TaxID=220873 RepID=A0ABQ9EUC5_TEGGR|nr:hypothetical protein KUTeg_014500 [Tegillarca granosa]